MNSVFCFWEKLVADNEVVAVAEREVVHGDAAEVFRRWN